MSKSLPMWEPADPVTLRGRVGSFTPGPAPIRRTADLQVESGPPPQKRPPSWTPMRPSRTVKPRALHTEAVAEPAAGLDYAPPVHLDEPQETLASAVAQPRPIEFDEAGIPSDFRGSEHDWFDAEADLSDFTVEPAPGRVASAPDLMLAASIAGGVLLLSTLVAAGAIAAAIAG